MAILSVRANIQELSDYALPYGVTQGQSWPAAIFREADFHSQSISCVPGTDKFQGHLQGNSGLQPGAYNGRREGILRWRKEQKQGTLDRRFRYNLGQAPDLTRDELGSEL